MSALHKLCAWSVIASEGLSMDGHASAGAWSDTDRHYMRLALELAERGRYTTSPNPCVACLVVRDDKIIAQDYHRATGEAHAEVLALKSAGAAASGATLYVTLEPCTHAGRTPPCIDVVRESGVARVVVAASDPNPQVNGQGVRALQDAGIDVVCGVLADDAEWQNRAFFTRMREGRPYVRIKLACSLDGRVGLQSGESAWISSEASRRDVQFWRARSDCLLTGANTVMTDDPQMNLRLSADELNVDKARQPARLVIDSQLKTNPQARIYDRTNAAAAIVAHCADAAQVEAFESAGVEAWAFDGDEVPLEEVLKRLAQREINEVQVEAGPNLCGALIKQGLYDELLIYMAPCVLGETGLPLLNIGRIETMSERLNLHLKESMRIGDNIRMLLIPEAR